MVRARAIGPPAAGVAFASVVLGCRFAGRGNAKPGAWPGLSESSGGVAAYVVASDGEGFGADDAFAASFQNSSRMSVVER